MIIYGIKNCDTMKKAFDWLNEHKIKYTFHDYRQVGITKPKIEEWLKQLPLNEVVNLRSTTYKELSEEDKLRVADKKKAIPIIMENPTIVKRPLFETGKGILLGFKKEEWEEVLLG